MHSVCIYFKHVLKIVLRLDEWLIHIYFLSLLKPETLENQMFSDVFRGWCRKEIMTWNGLIWVNIFLKSCWHRPSNSISKYVTPNHEAKISWITIVLLNSKIPMELLLPLLFLPHREIIVCIGVSPPTFHLKKSTPSFSPSSP